MIVINRPAPDGELVQELCRVRYFREVARGRLESLAKAARCYAFAPGEIIFMEGAPCAGLWIISSGRVKIFKLSPEGNEHILHLVGPGDSCNDIAALDGGPNPASAATLSDVIACCLPHAALREAIMAEPLLAMTVIEVLTGRTRELVQQVEDLALHSVTTRLARFLLKQLENPALSGPSVTRAAIAAHLAITPETLSRTLSALERAGVITTDRSTIRVLREDLLHVLAMQ